MFYEAGYAAALSRLEDRLTRAEQVAEQQREGILHVRSATERKRDLRRTIKLTHLNHLASVAQVAAEEVPELAQMFTLQPESNPYLAFRTAVRGFAAEAESRKELLVKHGLTETVLTGLAQALNEFDAAVDQGAEGRSAHVGASAELDTVANEVVQVVNVMAGLNRLRFAHDSELLASWESVSNVFATPRRREATDRRNPAGRKRSQARGMITGHQDHGRRSTLGYSFQVERAAGPD